MADEQENILNQGDTIEIFNYTKDFKGFIAQIDKLPNVILERGKYATFLFPTDLIYQTTRMVLVEKENQKISIDYTISFSG